MAVAGQAFTLVNTLTTGGGTGPAAGLVSADFPAGTVQVRKINEAGASPLAVSLTGGVDFEVEEVWALDGTYAFKFVAGVLPTAGLYVVRISGGPGAIDLLTGVVRAHAVDPEAELAWLSGKNTVAIVGGYDSENNPTSINVYGFDSAADADLYANNPDAHVGRIRFHVRETYVYEVSTGRPTKYTRKVL